MIMRTHVHTQQPKLRTFKNHLTHPESATRFIKAAPKAFAREWAHTGMSGGQDSRYRPLQKPSGTL